VVENAKKCRLYPTFPYLSLEILLGSVTPPGFPCDVIVLCEKN